MKGKTFDDMLKAGATYGQATLTESHRELYDKALAATEKVLDNYAIDEYYCEAFVQREKGVVGGSIDFIGESTTNKISMILDYKFGHHLVPVEGNESLQFYAMCAAADPDFTEYLRHNKIVYVIIQPKVSDEAMVWESNQYELDDFKLKWQKAYDNALSDKPAKSTGSHCRYCPVAPYCEVKKQQVLQAMMINPKQQEKLTDALVMADKLSSWIKEVEEAALSLLRKGVKLDGYKLVQKRPTSKWINAEQAEKELAEIFFEKIYKKDLLTPTQMGKIAKAEGKDISHLIHKVSSGTTIAPESDKRPAVDFNHIPDNLKALQKQ